LYFVEKYAEAAHICNSKSKLPIHYASANLSITPKTIQQLVLAWPQSSFEFCPKNNENDDDDDNDGMYEPDINDFDNN